MTTSSVPSAPIPGPRGAHPTPASMSGHAATTTPPRRTNNPEDHGRIDDDGTVWLITRDGERAIGEWKAGSKSEGFTFFGKHFDSLQTEADILRVRLHTHPEEAATTRKSAEELQAKVAESAALGDVDGLYDQLSSIIDDSYTVAEQAETEKKQRRENAIAQREKLIDEAERIGSDSTEWKESGDRLREMLNEWKSIHGIDRKTDDALWKRFSAAREQFSQRRGAHFAELDRKRDEARRLKEDICERAEKIQDSTEWRDTARQFRDLMTEWKAAGRAPRGIDDKLWKRFRHAQDTFFSARKAVNEAKDREYESNAEKKDQLIEQYSDKITPEENLGAAKKALRELQSQWESIGYVPRGRVREFEDKIRALENRVSDVENEQWRKTDPERQARVAQFEAKVNELSAAADSTEKAGNSKKAADLRAQAEQWAQWAQTAQQAVE